MVADSNIPKVWQQTASMKDCLVVHSAFQSSNLYEVIVWILSSEKKTLQTRVHSQSVRRTPGFKLPPPQLLIPAVKPLKSCSLMSKIMGEVFECLSQRL
jgi:hypothetical protein